MPKGRGSNERRRNRRTRGRTPEDDLVYVERLAHGRYKLEALFKRAIAQQTKRRKAARRALRRAA